MWFPFLPLSDPVGFLLIPCPILYTPRLPRNRLFLSQGGSLTSSCPDLSSSLGGRENGLLGLLLSVALSGVGGAWGKDRRGGPVLGTSRCSAQLEAVPLMRWVPVLLSPSRPLAAPQGVLWGTPYDTIPSRIRGWRGWEGKMESGSPWVPVLQPQGGSSGGWHGPHILF